MIARKTWQEVRVLALVYLLLLELGNILALIQYPELRSSTVARMVVTAVARSFDEGAVFDAYVALEVFFKGNIVVGIACAVLLGTGLIARERETNSLEFLLARPLSRSRVLAGKFVVCGLIVTVPLVLTSWTLIPLARWVDDQEMAFGEVTVAAAFGAGFCLLFFALTTLCSVLFRSQVQAAFAIGAAVVFELSIYLIQDIRDYSIFKVADFDVFVALLAGKTTAGQLFLDRALWLLLATAGAYGLADRVFARQEV